MKPYRNKEYLRFVAEKPCCACFPALYRLNRLRGLPSAGAAHHYGRTGKGMGQKCDDRETVPLCVKHHYQIHAYGKRVFKESNESDFNNISKRLMEEWNSQKHVTSADHTRSIKTELPFIAWIAGTRGEKGKKGTGKQ